MDLTGSAKTEDMLQAGHLALEDPNIDAVIFGLQPIAPGLADPDVMANEIVKHFGPGKTKKPFVVVEWGGKYPDDRTIRTILREKGVAVYPGAEEALRVLSKLAGYQEYLNDRTSITTEVGMCLLLLLLLYFLNWDECIDDPLNESSITHLPTYPYFS